MSLSVMSLSQIRDLVSNLGWRDQKNVYVRNSNCLRALESLEKALQNEDVVNRNVRIGLHICETVTKDLIPIIIFEKDPKIIAVTIRVLVDVSQPIECLFPVESTENSSKTQSVRKKLMFSALSTKKAFLNACATLSLVSILRESMIKSEKHSIPLKNEDCIHLKSCLMLLRNLLHIPEDTKSTKDSALCISDWQSVQKKLIWNIFVQGIDGALLMMLNSKYRPHWTEPLAFIIALIYRNQNASKIHQALEMISSSSESSEDEESDGSKNSSTSLSSEPTKKTNTSDSGYPLSDASFKNHATNLISSESSTVCCNGMDIQTKLQKVQLTDDGEFSNKEIPPVPPKNIFDGKTKHRVSSKSNYGHKENYSESSSSSESPLHKKIKGNCFSKDATVAQLTNDETVLSVNMDGSSADLHDKSSDDIYIDRKSIKNPKTHKMRNAQIHSKTLESDSSNEDFQKINTKQRSHPPVGWRGKSPRRNNGCIPSICVSSAIEASCSKGRFRYPLWEKRNSMSTLVDAKSHAPSDDDLRNLLKEFTMSFMHCGFSELIMDLKKLILKESSESMDKSLFFWIFSYFAHLASAVHISYEHLSDILSADVISFLVYECILACENLELHSRTNAKLTKYIAVHLSLIVTALKEVLYIVDTYSRKIGSQKEKLFFNNLGGILAGLQDLRLLPLLLFQSCPKANMKRYLEDVVIINHQIITISERNANLCWEPKRINLLFHLKLFSTPNIMRCYGRLFQNFKTNSSFLNECIFTMFHHMAGDVHSSHLLLEPSILKTFSKILQDDVDLEQYQEDLIMYILNKFSLQRKKLMMKQSKAENTQEGDSSDDSSSSCSSVESNCFFNEDDDDLFWWFLQFEQDEDPVSKISEHVSCSKQEILSKLQLKGIISPEKHKMLEETMKLSLEQSNELIQEKELVPVPDFDESITNLMRTLVQAGARQHLIWLQDTLLETCYAKLGFDYLVPECAVQYSIKMMLSVPLIPYTEEQRLILQDETFVQLLQKIGFHLSSGVYQMYPRIPLYWNTGLLFTIATRLGPIRKDKLKFTYEDLMQSNPSHEPITVRSNPCPALPPLSSCFTLSSWLTAVQQSKENYRAYKLNTAAL